MPRPRKEQVCIEETPYYHISSRCVRRAFLCGFDQSTQTSYVHRRQWIENRIRLLSSLFAIDVCAYAVMSNHYHIVLKLDPDKASDWSDEAVLQRWLCLFKGTYLVRQFAAGKPLSPIEKQSVTQTLSIYRQRLTDLSWFMKCLNEPIARQANKEDRCTGCFWEARFKSQALRNEPALITCMAYVDLNPVRAGMAICPEDSEHTSIKERLHPAFDLAHAVKEQFEGGHLLNFELSLKPLVGFSDSFHREKPAGIPLGFTDYLALVDWTGRSVREDKRGSIPNALVPILKRLNLSQNEWLANTTQFEQRYRQRDQSLRLRE